MEIGESQDVVNRVDSGKIRIHCVFPFEMEHMVPLAGLTVEHLFGDFERSAFSDQAEEMICVVIHARDGAGG
jgi:hypothetical protein